MGLVSRLSRRRRSIASVSTVSAFSTAIFALAIANPGFTAADVELNDSGIWVTRSDRSMVGRFNYEAQSLDGALLAASEDFDVVQQEDAVLVHDAAAGTLALVDVAVLEMPGTATLPAEARVGLGAAAVAVLDRAEGILWVVPAEDVGSFSTETTEPVLDGLEGGVLAVGVDGTAHVAVAATATLVSVPTDENGRPLDPTTRDLADVGPEDVLAITAVGGDAVVLDRDRGELYLPDSRAEVEEAEGLRLQEPGAPASAVVFATETALVSQPLSGGAPSVVDAEGSADPTTPVVVKGCAYGAWAGTGQVVRDCAGDDDDVVQSLQVLVAGAQLRYRTNRGSVVLNELTSGSVWLADQEFQLFDNWDDVLPTEATDAEEPDPTTEQSRDPLQDRDLPNRPPVAEDDVFGVRPGRTTILPILDNDSDPDGDVVTASLVGGEPSIGALDAIYGGKAMQITVSPDATGVATFEYEANDGRAGGTDRAAVRLEVRADGENGLPRMKDGRETVAVVEQQKSVTVDVLADWTDPDGDPLLLLAAEATTPGDEVRFRPDGMVTFQDAGTAQGRKAVRITVSDGVGEPVEGTLWVDVRPAGPQAPDAHADHATTVVDRAVVIKPLENDTDANADVLRLARVDAKEGVTITPDFDAGTITFLSSTPGTFDFTYLVTDGLHSVLGLVRVDVLPTGSGDLPPVAVRDRALLPAGGSVLVDVLVNDFDPAAGVLVVQSVQIPPQAGFSVAVLNHQVLRITAVRALTETVRIGYTVSNGLSSATGEVLVVPLDAPSRIQPPNAVPDEVSVRVGDVVTIPVLANDTHPNDLPISLVRDLVEAPDPSVGLIFTTEDAVRFQAGTEAGVVYAVYEITDEAGNRDSAQITIQIRALDPEHNAAPRPQNLTARVLAGTTTRIAIPLDGIDPDGDSVSLLGLDSAPEKGRIAGYGEGWMDYEASSGTTGPDEFTYLVRDAFGATAKATVLVGIAPASPVDQAPVALDDLVTARPGREVAVPVLANDIDPEGDTLQLMGGVEGAELSPEAVLDRVVVQTPTEPGTYSARYTIRDSFRAEATAALTVTVTADAPLRAPIARDDALTLADVVGRSAVDVPVLKNDDDPDGSTADLTVRTTAPTARPVGDGQIRVTLSEAAQILPYTVTDVDGLTATAFVRVPGLADLRPTLKPLAEPVTVVSGETLTVELADYVQVADGREPIVTEVEKVSALHGVREVVDANTLTFTSVPDYYGPAALVFEVTDGASVEDPEGRIAMLTLPITVQPGSNRPPTFTAPAVTVPAGEEASTDLVPYATDPDPDDAERLRFSIPGDVPDGFSARVDGGTTLLVSADPDVPVGTTASLALEVTDGTTDAVRAEATLTVSSSSKPLATVNDETIPDANQGEAETVDVLANDVSPFPGEALDLVSATAETPGAGTAQVDGSRVVVTPGRDFVGTMVVRYRVADVTGDPLREVDGRIRLTVRGVPEAPLTPTVLEVRSHTIVLTWAPPVNNGAPITTYKVTSPQGFSRECPATTCTLDGLTNNVEYTFSVVATNEVGDSEPSPQSSPERPDERPDMPAPPTLVFGDRFLTVTWANASYSDRSPITSVNLEISPAPPSGGVQVTGVSGTQYTWNGLENGTAYQVRIQAVNSAPEPSDWGPYSATEIPAGIPAVPAAPTTSMLSPVGNQAQMNVTWAAPANNGDAIASYSLQVSGGSGGQTITVPGGQTSQAVTVNTSESSYTFTVSATNKAGTSAPSAPSAPRRGVVAPGPVTGLSAAPLDNAIQLTFGPAAGNGATASEIRYQYSVNGGAWNNLAADKVIRSGVPNNGTYTASVRAVSTVDGAEYVGPGTAANAVAPYGPPGTPAVSATQGVTTVHVCWSPPGRNGRDFRVETSFDGGGWADRGTSGCADLGNGYSQAHSIAARTVDTESQISPTASATARSQDPPPPSLSVSKGSEAQGEPGCTNASCAFLVLNVSNFPAGTYNVECWDESGADAGRWYTHVGVSLGASDSKQLYCYFGYPGQSVSLRIAGTTMRTPSYVW